MCFPCKGVLVCDPVEFVFAGLQAGWLLQQSDLFLFSFDTDVSSWSREYLAASSLSEVDGFRLVFWHNIYKALKVCYTPLQVVPQLCIQSDVKPEQGFGEVFCVSQGILRSVGFSLSSKAELAKLWPLGPTGLPPVFVWPAKYELYGRF